MGTFETEWSDWWLYQQIFEVANNLHELGKGVVANSKDTLQKDDVQQYFLHNFVSLFDAAGVTLEEVTLYWLKRDVEQHRRTEEQAEQAVAVLKLLTAEPKQPQRDSDVPVPGIVS